MGRLTLTGASVIDAVTEGARSSTVTVDDGVITSIGQPAPVTAGEHVLDLEGRFLLPGLWDVHTHLESSIRPRDPSVAEQTIRYADQARRGLEAGIVGIRTGGLPHFIDVALRDAITEGTLVGPTIRAGGHFLTTTGGHLAWSAWTRESDGPDGFARAVRDQIKHGVDHVKLSLSGGIMGPVWDRHTRSYWREDELDAAFDVARLRGFPVMAHATNPESVEGALRRGARSIEHGYVMDDRCIDLFGETGAWYVPTLCISHLTPSQAESPWERRWVEARGLRPDLVARADAAAGEHRHWFRRALDAGVRMAVGSDAFPLADALFQEMELWVKDGASPFRTIVGATRDAAELCGLGDQTGTIEVRKRADLIAVRKNPLDDINALREVDLVVQAGRTIVDRM